MNFRLNIGFLILALCIVPTLSQTCGNWNPYSKPTCDSCEPQSELNVELEDGFREHLNMKKEEFEKLSQERLESTLTALKSKYQYNVEDIEKALAQSEVEFFKIKEEAVLRQLELEHQMKQKELSSTYSHQIALAMIEEKHRTEMQRTERETQIELYKITIGIELEQLELWLQFQRDSISNFISTTFGYLEHEQRDLYKTLTDCTETKVVTVEKKVRKKGLFGSRQRQTSTQVIQLPDNTICIDLEKKLEENRNIKKEYIEQYNRMIKNFEREKEAMLSKLNERHDELLSSIM